MGATQNQIYNTQYPQSDYNDYYNTLHPKMDYNPLEVPNMPFNERKGRMDLIKLRKLDINKVIKTNNLYPLEKLAENLIFSEIKEDDYEDKCIPKLLKTFQYALEYLNTKQNRLEKVNNDLEIEYNQLINDSYSLEETLKNNKMKIEKNNLLKKDKENLLSTYKSIVNFNCNPDVNCGGIVENIQKTTILKNVNITKNVGRGYTDNRGGWVNGSKGKFYCHICSGKAYSTEYGLESHMKRRHLAQTQKDMEKEKENQKEEEAYAEYGRKIEDMKSYFQNLIQQQNQENEKEKYQDDLMMIKRENEEKIQEMEKYTKTILEELKVMVKTNLELQNQNNQNLIENLNKKQEEKEPRYNGPRNEEINNLAKSIEDMNNLIKQQNDKKLEELKNEINILKEQNLNSQAILNKISAEKQNPPPQPQPQIIYLPSPNYQPQFQPQPESISDQIKNKKEDLLLNSTNKKIKLSCILNNFDSFSNRNKEKRRAVNSFYNFKNPSSFMNLFEPKADKCVTHLDFDLNEESELNTLHQNLQSNVIPNFPRKDSNKVIQNFSYYKKRNTNKKKKNNLNNSFRRSQVITAPNAEVEQGEEFNKILNTEIYYNQTDKDKEDNGKKIKFSCCKLKKLEGDNDLINDIE